MDDPTELFAAYANRRAAIGSPLILQADELLTGKIDRAILQRGKHYIAWTKTWEGPARPDYAAALADLRDHT